MIKPQIKIRKMDAYDLKFIRDVLLYGERLDIFNNFYCDSDLNFKSTDTYSVHIYKCIICDNIPVQVLLVLFKGECIEYFIREIN